MTTTTLVKTPRTLKASTSVAAAGVERGTVDLRTGQGGILTVKITNGATGPGVPCTCNILIAHSSGVTPAAGSAGADWKTLWSFTGNTANNGIVERSVEIGPGVQHLEVEFKDHTAQAVTVEAFLSEITNATTV